MRNEGIPSSKTNGGYGREETLRQSSRRRMPKKENLKNVKGSGGIPLYIGS